MMHTQFDTPTLDQLCLAVAHHAEGKALEVLTTMERPKGLPLMSAYLKARAAEMGLTAGALARLAGTSRQYVYQIFSGACAASDDFLRAVAATTDIGLAELAVVRAVEFMEAR